MFGQVGPAKVFVATRPVDFRKGSDGLALAVQELFGLDPFCPWSKAFGNPSMPFVAFTIKQGTSVTPFSLVTRIGSRLTPAARRLADAIQTRTDLP